MKKRKKKRFKLKRSIKFLLFLIIIIIILFPNFKNNEKNITNKSDIKTCLNNYKVDMEDEKQELDSYLSNYKVSVLYQNKVDDLSYKYNEEEAYYSASTIKIIDALYIYEKAEKQEINLASHINNLNDVNKANSKIINSSNIKDLTIRDLVKYLITFSDNRAHILLVNNYGFNTLSNFNKSLGTNYYIKNYDYYTTINLHDANIYLNRLYKYLSSNGKYSNELKEYFANKNDNYINLDERNIASSHKFGYYGTYFHDIGIIYDNNPYLIAVLTKEANNDYANIIHNISLKINDFHKKYYIKKELGCLLKEVKSFNK